MFQVINSRTEEVKLETTDIVEADIVAYRENDKEIGVGYEPCWEVRYVILDEKTATRRSFRITVEEL